MQVPDSKLHMIDSIDADHELYKRLPAVARKGKYSLLI